MFIFTNPDKNKNKKQVLKLPQSRRLWDNIGREARREFWLKVAEFPERSSEILQQMTEH